MTPPPVGTVGDSLDHLFRHHAGRMVSVLSRMFGLDRLDAIEDAVQDAMIAALRRWSFTGMPENPTAWLTQAARNRMIDTLRRDARSEPTGEDFDVPDDREAYPAYFDSELPDDQLRMMFACCHPSIPRDVQVALTLKIVGGFSVAEVASAYLSSEAAVAKMLSRAKARLREGRIEMEIPAAGDISRRLDAVLRVLYLMFNEGYSASGGGELTRRDLCFEAIRLVDLLARHPVTRRVPKVHAAAALFLFQAARLPARTDHLGDLVLLVDQDRAVWDRRLAARGLHHLKLSAAGDEITAYHLEAEIAGVYTLADSFAATDWRRILECYDILRRLSFSPVAELNRIIVLARLEGWAAALTEMEAFSAEPGLADYSLFHLTRGHLLAESGAHGQAVEALEKALSLTKNETVRNFLKGRIGQVGAADAV